MRFACETEILGAFLCRCLVLTESSQPVLSGAEPLRKGLEAPGQAGWPQGWAEDPGAWEALRPFAGREERAGGAHSEPGRASSSALTPMFLSAWWPATELVSRAVRSPLFRSLS